LLLDLLFDFEKTPAARAYTAREYNLDGFRAWLESLGNPQSGQQFVHVAGTRGKGSTAAMTEALLHGLGFPTAMYSSPHLAHYGERFRFDGVPWTEAEFVARLEQLEAGLGPEQRKCFEGPTPWRTVFEVLTTLALLEFRNRSARLAASGATREQVVLWETGLGGRLDCTNVVDPLVSVITTLGLDHTKTLGATIDLIAAEKAGIIKPGRPVIVARQLPEFTEQVWPVILRKAEAEGAPVVRAHEHNPVLDAQPREDGQMVRFRLPDGREGTGLLPLFGAFQLTNFEAALAAMWYVAREAGLTPAPEQVARAMEAVCWPGRIEVVRGKGGRTLVLDGAHCPLGAREAATTIARWNRAARAPARGPWRLLWGMQEDKDHASFFAAMLTALGRENLVEVLCYPTPGPRGARGEALAVVAEKNNVPVRTFASPAEAMAVALEGKENVLAMGTLYTLAGFGAQFRGN
jgi:dihydrofolate synthase/folylpolyglutamate synthase